jgi:hypothetical protein
LLLHRGELAVDQLPDVRARFRPAIPQRQDLADLPQRQADALGLDDEAQPVAVRVTVAPVAGGVAPRAGSRPVSS